MLPDREHEGEVPSPEDRKYRMYAGSTFPTIMVYNLTSMPIHDLDAVRYLIQEDAWELATRTCKRDVQNLGLTREGVKAILLAVSPQDHRSTFGKAGSDFGDVFVDDYRLWFDEETQTRCPPRGGTFFYLKFGIHSTDEGDVCLVVSLHLDSRP